MTISDQLLDELIGDAKTQENVFGTSGLMPALDNPISVDLPPSLL